MVSPQNSRARGLRHIVELLRNADRITDVPRRALGCSMRTTTGVPLSMLTTLKSNPQAGWKSIISTVLGLRQGPAQVFHY